MTISVNGDNVSVVAGTTIAQLLAQLGLGGKTVAVERNRAIVPRAQHSVVELESNDQLEVVTFVGGG
ncbi:MAG: sulfur carrier protein ThiS [Kofleriaceae bacterium]|nr:sulfur carrier protein ThiS [Kofleriaceae bacterium]